MVRVCAPLGVCPAPRKPPDRGRGTKAAHIVGTLSLPGRAAPALRLGRNVPQELAVLVVVVEALVAGVLVEVAAAGAEVWQHSTV